MDLTASSSFLATFARSRAFLLGRPSRAAVTSDGQAVLYLRSEGSSSGHDLYEWNVASGQERLLCTAADLRGAQEEALSPEERARRERQRITDTGITQYALSPGGRMVLIPLAGALFLLERLTGSHRRLLPVEHPPVMDARFSPDGTALTFVCNHDVWRLPLPLSLEAPLAPPVRLTPGGTAARFFGSAEFVAQEEMHRFDGYWSSPSGHQLLVAVVDEHAVEAFVIADPAHPERAPVSFRYPRPGKANAEVGLLVVAAMGVPGIRQDPVEVTWDKAAYPYLARVSWHAPNRPPVIWVQSRDQRLAVLLLVDVATGQTRELRHERDDDWINLWPGLPRWRPDGQGVLHVSEAAGAPALLCLDPEQGSPKEIVPSSAGFLGFVCVDVLADKALVLLGDALTSRLARVSLASGSFAPEWLEDDGTGDRSAIAYGGPSGVETLVETFVSQTSYPQVRVRGHEGSVVAVLPDVAEAPPFKVDVELLTVGPQALHAAVIRPNQFEINVRYPVIVHVYGGPHAQMVKADRRHYVFDQWLANHGAIVVAIDNRGTPRRGRSWERAIKGRLGEVPLADQVEGLEGLAELIPQMDLSRVGIYGWSFGGFMAALAVLRRPDLFKVAVAGAPVVDWHDYDTHYTERYLDLPAAAPAAYAEANLLEYADGLSRPLLLVHGTADDNVYLFHSLKLADALLRAGRPFDFLPLPGTTHQIGDPLVRERVWGRVAQYLFAHL